MSVFNRMKAFLFSDDAADAPAPRRTAGAPHLRVVAGAAPLPRKIQAGNLQMIGLQAVRDALGDDWAKRRETIHSIVEGVIRERLDAGDTHYHLENDDYLVLFLQLNHAQAKAKAAAIAQEAERLILGELPEHHIHIASTVAEVDSSFLASKVNSMDELLQHVKAGGVETNGATTASGDVLMFGDEPVHDGFAETAQQRPAPMMGAGPDLTDLDQSLDMLFQKKKSASFLKECQASFYPNFSVKRRAFSFYTVHVTHMPTGRTADASDPMLEDPEELEFLLDRYRLTTALLGLHRMVTGGHKGFITIPVTFATLATSRTRNIYLERFKDLPAGLFRSLSIVMTNIPNGTPGSRIADAFNYVQRYCAVRTLNLAPDPRLIDLYAQTGCHAFSTGLPTEIADPAARFQALSAFTKRAAWHKMESILWNVNDATGLELGVNAGFGFLCGDAVAPQIATPGHRQALRADHIPQRMVVA
ncbi:hypothetical protein FNB15_13920 [Ferrovibrio terrae]|uniref:Uncharacterized protein n=1 Tax=Ferrovibrio terrae TaxID=2594003 RepID=A0A516H3X8_9PROT|nr:hypothetical protein [Ferrovibrio terrae]QDO98300.1 hypothetical protein FNB15_13920 [Ferrovibrio terrae]